MRRAWRRCGCAAVMAIGLAGLTRVPVTASDSQQGPLEIRIFGAKGEVRDFLARSTADRRSAIALVNQIDGATEGPVRAIEDSAIMLPHYRIEVSQLGPAYVTAPWARVFRGSFIYFPGGSANSFMVVEFTRGRAALEQRWILPEPQVAALFDRHLQGLRPIDLESAVRAPAAPWEFAFGAALLAAISLRVLADRRRWWLTEKGRSTGKGTDRRSLRSAAGKLPSP